MRIRIAVFWLAVGVWALVAFKTSHSNQPPVGYTGAPGDNGTCRNCHSGGTGTPTISLTMNGQAPTTYIPGGPSVPMQVTVSHASASLYGFQVTVLSSQTGQENTPNQGLSTTGATGVVLQTGAGGRKYVGHNPASATGTWSFSWTPPATNVGPITWYIAANAANGNGTTSGDAVGTLTVTLQPDVSAALSESKAEKLFTQVGGTLSFAAGVQEVFLYTLDGRAVGRWERPTSLGLPGPGLYFLRLRGGEKETLHRVLWIGE